MQLHSINAENWKMDGGAVFGVVPKTIWHKLYPAGEENLVPMKTRCLLVEEGDNKILVDTGMGRKQNGRYYKYKYLFDNDDLLVNLGKAGIMPEEITHVLLTHLHDDHVGGAVYQDEDNQFALIFPNAMHYVSRLQYDWAMDPNPRESAAYFKDNFLPLQKAGKLTLLDPEEALAIPHMELRFYNGHTRGQLIPIISTPFGKLVFTADFIPSTAHIPLPYVASVDIEPLRALEEKKQFLSEAIKNDYTFFFQHDYYTECCKLKQTEKGIRSGNTFEINAFMRPG